MTKMSDQVSERQSPLQAERVRAIFVESVILTEMFDEATALRGNGVTGQVPFDAERLEAHRDEVRAMLAELPEQFRSGWSFLCACHDRDERLWTGLHQDMEQLFQMGTALDLAEKQDFGEMFGIPGLPMPGGMPYFRVKVGEGEERNEGGGSEDGS